MTTHTVSYVVMAEHTLGYIDSRAPATMGVLRGSVQRGGHSDLNGPVIIGTSPVRAATPADFDAYRVAIPPDFT